MSTDPETEWLIKTASTVRFRSEDLFGKIWDQARLRYSGEAASTSKSDQIDRVNAELISATLERGLQLLIVLPDDASRRAPLLFSSALVAHWWDSTKRSAASGLALYFGTTVGIRQHLAQTNITGLSLKEVFPQYSPKSGARGTGLRRRMPSLSSEKLPEVICAYSPSDPTAIIDAFQPSVLS